jgi:hypothetical protein
MIEAKAKSQPKKLIQPTKKPVARPYFGPGVRDAQ